MPDLSLDASFWSRALATLVGTVAGFVFSIVIFYITESVKRSHERTKIVAGLNREATFNIGLCDTWLKGISELRLKVAAGNRNVFNYFDYTRALRIFVTEGLKAGILYELLSDAELVELDKALRFVGAPQSEQYINEKVAQWKVNQITPADFSAALDFHEYVIGEAKKGMTPVRDKTAPKRPKK
jgi:putative component of toxin-antitoxin plasmid stabilization module